MRIPSGSESKIVSRVALVLVGAALSVPALSSAEPPAESPSAIQSEVGHSHIDVKLNVVVREVQADGLLPHESQDAVAQVEQSIQDLAPQLQRLNYAHYRLVQSHNFIVPPRRKETISLRGGNSLTVRPLGMEGDKICVWIKWRGKGGMQILDTRMRFVSGESMITGTERNDDSGLILAIDVRPVEQSVEQPD